MCCAIQNIHAYKCNPSQILLYKRKHPEDEAPHPFSQKIALETAGGITTNTIPSLTSTTKMSRQYIIDYFTRERKVIRPSRVGDYLINMLTNTFVFTGLFAYSQENKQKIIDWFDRNVPEDIS